MKVRLSDISEEGLTVTEALDPAKTGLDAPDLIFTAPVGVTAAFQKQQETVWVEVGVEGDTQRTCARCLESFGRPYDSRFHLDYSVDGKLELDITDDVRQEILLSYPVRFLCRDDCRGLCPQCGTNLNERICTHASS
jgi:uncharacterized protein